MCFSIHTPKVNRDLMRDFAKKNLDISKAAINLILHLTPFIDRDGKIHINLDSVRRKMVCDRRSFNKALNELLENTYNNKKLITYENGYYVSNFHLSSKGEKSYLKHLPFFNSPEFLNLSLNQTRLFLYIATLNIKNQYTKVAVENLYKNNLHDFQYGMDVYHSYQDMREDLFHLIDNGFIFVRLPGVPLHINKDDATYKNRFNEACGFKSDRKIRTSKFQKNKHVIGLKVNPALYEVAAVENEASKAELRLLCDRYHMFHEDMKEETFNFMNGKKNEMMEQFGLAGLSIYRSSLEKYFNEKHENIIYYDLLGKVTNHFTDFYLLEEIKKVILEVLKFDSDLWGRGELTIAYPFNQTDIPSLVKYFIANSSDEHKVLIDQDIQLIKEAADFISGINAADHWIDLADSIEAVYVTHTPKVKELFLEECDKNGFKNGHILFEKIDSKELVLSLAKKSFLSQQKTLDAEAKKIKQIVRFFKKKRIPIIPSIYPRHVEEQAREVRKITNWLA